LNAVFFDMQGLLLPMWDAVNDAVIKSTNMLKDKNGGKSRRHKSNPSKKSRKNKVI
jgi:hypothetical protein